MLLAVAESGDITYAHAAFVFAVFVGMALMIWAAR